MDSSLGLTCGRFHPTGGDTPVDLLVSWYASVKRDQNLVVSAATQRGNGDEFVLWMFNVGWLQND